MTVNYIEGWMKAIKPHHILRLLRANGWLRQHAPEIERLYGIPQRPEHHPEIDVGVHTELVLEIASELTCDPKVRFAALVHDLGKALTPPQQWPRHHNHEELGVEPVRTLCARLGVPAHWQQLAETTARFHLRCHQALEAEARTLVRFFRDAGFFENPELVEPFTLACEADARGRAGFQSSHYPQGQRVRKAFVVAHKAKAVHAKQDLHEARIQAVAAELGR